MSLRTRSLFVADDGVGVAVASLPLMGTWFTTSKEPPEQGLVMAEGDSLRLSGQIGGRSLAAIAALSCTMRVVARQPGGTFLVKTVQVCKELLSSPRVLCAGHCLNPTATPFSEVCTATCRCREHGGQHAQIGQGESSLTSFFSLRITAPLPFGILLPFVRVRKERTSMERSWKEIHALISACIHL